MSEIKELWDLSWTDGLLLTFMLMALYTYKVWIDNKFKEEVMAHDEFNSGAEAWILHGIVCSKKC